MAADSKRKRHLRRVKRAGTLARQRNELQQIQIQGLVDMVVKARQELKDLQPSPSITINTLPDDPDNYYPADEDALPPAGPITEEMNCDCCIDDSPARLRVTEWQDPVVNLIFKELPDDVVDDSSAS